jgi:glycerate 2-kinase
LQVIKKDLKKNIRDLSGAGASQGALGEDGSFFWMQRLRVGVNLIIDTIGLEEKIKEADLVITGEGALDRQTFFGKSAYGVAQTAKRYEVAVITINGSVMIDKTPF